MVQNFISVKYANQNEALILMLKKNEGPSQVERANPQVDPVFRSMKAFSLSQKIYVRDFSSQS